MTIEEARSLMLTLDELREMYAEVKRTGEEQRSYLLEGDCESGIAVYIKPGCGLGFYDADFIAAEDRHDLSHKAGDKLFEFGAQLYASSGDAYHGLRFLGWACFRSKEDAEAWEAATLGHGDKNEVAV